MDINLAALAAAVGVGVYRLSRTGSKRVQREFDYVIVGAGSAGCVLASRLTEDKDVSVLLLEAGIDDNANEVKVPLASSVLQHSPRDWAYQTVPQKHACKSMTGLKSNWPRGKTLGGCSSINYLAYVRGNHADYDQWEEMGCEGWGAADMLRCFKKSEGNTVAGLDPAYHSSEGPLKVGHGFLNDMSRRFVEACAECGIPHNPDYNGEHQLGASLQHATMHNGQRCSTADAFLRPATSRPNLHVWTKAQVTRVLMEHNRDGQLEATGVEFRQDEGEGHRWGTVQCVSATREVILCGGSVNSPQLLMLSGIGDKRELEELGVQSTVHLPGVGRNLQDHLMLTSVFNSALPTITRPRAESVWSLLQYVAMKSGPLASNGLEGTAFLHTGTRPDLQDRGVPDLQVHFVASGGSTKDSKNFNFNDETHSLLETNNYDEVSGVAFLVILLHPESIGSIKLRSSDPLDAPLIDPRYLHNARDVESLASGLHLVLHKLSKAEAWKGALQELRPGLDTEYEVGSMDWCRLMARHNAATVYHPVGTCKMGREDDESTVVTPTCRVKGVQRLRVVDCSIMPTLPSGNTNAPAIAVAERAAELIRAQRVVSRLPVASVSKL